MMSSGWNGKERPSAPVLPSMERRQFLKALGGGIIITFCLDSAAFSQGRGGMRELPTDWNAFIRIGEDGRVTCYTGKIEMGQGIITSFAQMAAEELAVPLSSIDMVMGDTDLCPWDRGTFGSRSTKDFGPALRAAAAEARAVLVELASKRLDAPAGQLETRDGAVWVKGSDQRVTYADLTGGKRIEKHIDAALKPHSQYTLSGTDQKRMDGLEKVTGKTKYTGDIHIPGMVYAKIVRPPAHGARLRSVDTSKAEKMSGVRIIREEELVAVLHERPDLAERALSTIKAEYDVPEAKVDEDSIYKHLSNILLQGEEIATAGDIEAGKKSASKTIEAIYTVPYVAHAPMETHTALARVEGNRVTVWASTQRPFGARGEVAAALGIPEENVRIITPHVGGGFGSKSRHGQVIEAARLAKLSGKPVQVAWTREEEFFYDTFQPAAFVSISSGLNPSNRIAFWDYSVNFAGDRASEMIYESPNVRVISYGGWYGAPDAHPFPTGAWRGPGANTNNFARESHIDMMAAAAGMDPLAFRLANLKEERLRRALNSAAERFGWSSTKLPEGRGRGVACTNYLGTCVAMMAEVEVDGQSGSVAVKRVVCAQDMGEIINPEGAAMQIEGCITMGLGYALTEEVRFKGGDVLDRNFDSYEIPRFSWVPKIEVVLIDNPEMEPQGCGEPAITCMGAVLANAVFNATGARVNQIPMTAARVKEALAAMKS